MSLKGAIVASQQKLPISPIHEVWMTEHGSEIVWSPEALEFARRVLNKEIGGARRRKRLFRASSAGSCGRKQLFAVVGAPRITKIESRAAGIFANGNFVHLRWQMLGLTAGWIPDIDHAETARENESLFLGGTLDAISYKDTGVEIKSINSRGYRSVMQYGAKEDHQFQTDAYMLVSGLETFSIIYENKDTQEWREFRHDRTDKGDRATLAELEWLNNHRVDGTLPKMLPECELGEGSTFRQCPFRKICPTAKRLPKEAS